MAEIKKFGFVRHLRAEPSTHVLCYRRGQLRRSGPGLSFWFRPLTTSVSEVPLDDREVSFVFHGRSADFQDVAAQGVILYRVLDAEKLARRVDFGLDLRSGAHREQPLDKIALVLTQLAQQLTQTYLATTPLRSILTEGYEAIRTRIAEGLSSDEGLQEAGLAVVSVRVSSIKPIEDLERALEAPIREQIQQRADEAAFERRALAVEKERAIQENELKNRIELSKLEENLITQEGLNQRRSAQESVEAQKIETVGNAERSRIQAEAEADKVRLAGAAHADSVRLVEQARAEAEQERMKAYRDLSPAILFGLAARKLGSKLEKIEHLNLAPDAFGPLLTDLLRAGARRLESGQDTAQEGQDS